MTTTIETVNDPWQALTVAILKRAKMDAARGDVGALAWLIVAGADYADAITDGAGASVLRFCRDVWAKMDADQVKLRWEVSRL